MKMFYKHQSLNSKDNISLQNQKYILHPKKNQKYKFTLHKTKDLKHFQTSSLEEKQHKQWHPKKQQKQQHPEKAAEAAA